MIMLIFMCTYGQVVVSTYRYTVCGKIHTNKMKKETQCVTWKISKCNVASILCILLPMAIKQKHIYYDDRRLVSN